MHRYLLEVGTEELPVGFQTNARQELTQRITQQLQDWGALEATVTVWTTPRRLTVILDQLPTQQADKSVRLQGPALAVAKNATGEWTPAAHGFARKNQTTVEALTVEGQYVVLNQQQAGQPFNQLVAQAVPAWILDLSGSHFMQWGDCLPLPSGVSARFSRPIRWVLSLWNDALLPVTIAHVTANTTSVGHRLLSPTPSVPITRIADYEPLLAEHGVIVNQANRKRMIAAQLDAAAKQVQGHLMDDDDLLDTITALVENPHVVTGRFDTQFLRVPDVVLTTVMKHHQKYAAVTDAQGQLMPMFLAVSNARPEAANTIAAGNERVLTARFHDAAFFYEDDLRQTLAQRVDALAGLTFQKGLGTLRQKADRLVSLTGAMAHALGLSAEDTQHAQRAALLCKADLTTGMVRELTELQGDMGAIYARETGEPDAVANAIREHYYPRFSGDGIAKTPAGIAVSLADKLDTLVAVFTQSGAKLPSGSKDPLGLRRLANGLWQTLWDYPKTVNLYPLMELVLQALQPFNPRPWDDARPLLTAFLNQRLDTLLLERQIRTDWVQAVLGVCDPLADLAGFRARLGQLALLASQPDQWMAVVQPATRVARILPARAVPLEPLTALVIPAELDVENHLKQAILALPQGSTGLLNALGSLQAPITTLFDQRMINDPDPAIKAIRISLLQSADAVYTRFADFSLLSDALS
jgi:glycyl-tRNA synthetase beta chain